jgi:hypothetical protein
VSRLALTTSRCALRVVVAECLAAREALSGRDRPTVARSSRAATSDDEIKNLGVAVACFIRSGDMYAGVPASCHDSASKLHRALYEATLGSSIRGSRTIESTCATGDRAISATAKLSLAASSNFEPARLMVAVSRVRSRGGPGRSVWLASR